MLDARILTENGRMWVECYTDRARDWIASRLAPVSWQGWRAVLPEHLTPRRAAIEADATEFGLRLA